jgi:hypothetical protein
VVVADQDLGSLLQSAIRTIRSQTMQQRARHSTAHAAILLSATTNLGAPAKCGLTETKDVSMNTMRRSSERTETYSSSLHVTPIGWIDLAFGVTNSTYRNTGKAAALPRIAANLLDVTNSSSLRLLHLAAKLED